MILFSSQDLQLNESKFKSDTGENVKRNYSFDSPVGAIFKGLRKSSLTGLQLCLLYTGLLVKTPIA